jgi:exosortase E/protease (VPEID-CTERM system)
MTGQTRPVFASASIPPRFFSPASLGLFPRLVCLAVLFALELVAFCAWFDADLVGDFRHWGAAVLRGIVVFAALLASIGYARAKSSLEWISTRFLTAPIAPRLLLAHFCAILAFAFLSARLFPNHLPGLRTSLVAAAWLVAGALAIALATFAFGPPRLWLRALRATGSAWGYALLAGICASLLGKASQLLWAPATRATFVLVRSILSPWIAGLTTDVATSSIGTRSFAVTIAPRCSGLEGAGLMIAMGAVWLWLFRRDFRFPQAFLLIPVGVGTLFLLNALRIAALILIGDAGAPGIAVRGFHSQAGWIAFNGVALGFSLAAPRVPWLSVKERAGSVSEAKSGDPNTAYLAPLLAVLVVAMISRAATAQFEWLYPLRFFAAAAVLWRYRSEYRRMDWSFGWISVATGSAAFAMWLALDLLLAKPGAAGAAGIAMATASPAARIAWIAIRAFAAVTTVPIVEELAFRGFLLRRIVSPAFLSVSIKSVTLLPALISSIAFGVLHGDRWLAGAAAGLLYAVAFRRRGRIGDAAAAHATTNVMLAAYVVLRGEWSLW